MLNASEIKNAKFSKAMGGYKQEEVDILLDNIEADYTEFELTIKNYQARLETLEKENEELKASQSSIQSVLLSAQRLADRIVNEAKEKSEEIIQSAEANISVITAKEKELSANFELKASERKAQLERELCDMVEKANQKAESITAAANDSVARQQMLFDKLKMEVAAFRSLISSKYKEHIEILNTIPDTVPMDPTRMAEVVTFAINEEPNPKDFIVASPTSAEEAPVTDVVSQEVDDSGFVVADSVLEDTEE